MNKEEKNKKLQEFRDKTTDVCPVVGYKSGRRYLVCKEKSGNLIIKESFKNRLKNGISPAFAHTHLLNHFTLILYWRQIAYR